MNALQPGTKPNSNRASRFEPDLEQGGMKWSVGLPREDTETILKNTFYGNDVFAMHLMYANSGATEDSGEPGLKNAMLGYMNGTYVANALIITITVALYQTNLKDTAPDSDLEGTELDVVLWLHEIIGFLAVAASALSLFISTMTATFAAMPPAEMYTHPT